MNARPLDEKLNIAILSTDPTLYSTRRLKEAAIAAGISVRLVDYLRCCLIVRSGKPEVLYQGHTVEGMHAVIPRIGASYTGFGTSVVRQFEVMGVFAANSSDAILSARDKLRSLQVLSQAGIQMPVTGHAHANQDHTDLIQIVGNAPIVIKLVEGTQGIGVVLADTDSAAKSVVEAFRGLNADFLVQEFVKEASGQDLRCFVVGGKVVAAMVRKASGNEFRANIHRGASAEPAKLTQEESIAAVASARALGLDIAGVDMLRSRRGPLVIEVNASPGLEGIEKTTGVDVAGEIIKWVAGRASLSK
jgi:ribosomal protein S6--L-glutamate ligase